MGNQLAIHLNFFAPGAAIGWNLFQADNLA